MTEKRQHPRRPLRFEVELTHPGGRTRRVTTRDLSIGGMFVESTDEVPPLGMVLRITFQPSSSHAGTYTLRARVQRQTMNGFAMTFIDFTLQDLDFIEGLLAL